jgi:hypothetical protein
VQRHLEAKGLKITTGTIVDTTAPSSTKNATQAREGQPVVFPPEGALTSANVADSATRPIAASGR